MGLFSGAKEKIADKNYAKGLKEKEHAFEYFKKAADLGDIRSCFQLARIYCLGNGVESDWKKADYWIKEGLKKKPLYSFEKEDIVKILSDLPEICKEKEHFEQVYTWIDKTFSWYRKNEGEYEILWKAMINLAKQANKQEIVVSGFYRYALETYSKKTFEHMKILLEGAAKSGDARAQYQYGQMYEKGQYFAKDQKKALKWYEKAAENGDEDAQFRCAEMYHKGLGTVVNDKKALQWFEKVAEKGQVEAQFRCAEMYHQGLGTAINEKKAIQWYEKAGEQGHTNAQLFLIDYYGFSDQALYWVKKAKENGVKDVEETYKDNQKNTNFNHAMELYNKGEYAEALPLLEKGPGVGVDWRYAYFLCAEMYRKGMGTGVDNKKAIQFYAKAVQIAGFSGNLELEREIEKLEDVGEALLLFAQYSYSLGKDADRQTLPAMEGAATYGYIVAFLRLAVLYQRNGEPEKAVDSFRIWLNSINPGETYSFGSFPQSEQFLPDSKSIAEAKRDPVYWDVLHIEEDRALLLCHDGLLFHDGIHHFEEFGGLFSEEEQPFVLEEYSLTKEEAQEYIFDKKYALSRADATFYARTMYAYDHGLEVEQDYQNGGYKVGFHSEGEYQFKIDQARNSRPMLIVTNGSGTWKLRDGFICSFDKILPPEEKDSFVRRSAFWVGIKKPEK